MPRSVVLGDADRRVNSNNWTIHGQRHHPSWETVRDRTVTQGRFIDNQDVADHTAVAVLGSDTASELFSGSRPGRPDGQRQRRADDGHRGAQLGRLLVVDHRLEPGRPGHRADQHRHRAHLRHHLAQLHPDPGRLGSTLSAAYQEADTELLALHGITTPADADFTIASEQSLVSTATSVDRTLTILLGGVAGISLLVGGIGVMNIMLVSVTERIREIGLRKALGATPPLIRRQFLLEASVLGLTGGALGRAAGRARAGLLPDAIGYPITLSVSASVGALVVAIAIGLVFGVYPASRAARLAPIDALRSE